MSIYGHVHKYETVFGSFGIVVTLGLLLHFYLLHECFLLDYETILSDLKLYKLSFRKYNLSKY